MVQELGLPTGIGLAVRLEIVKFGLSDPKSLTR